MAYTQSTYETLKVRELMGWKEVKFLGIFLWNKPIFKDTDYDVERRACPNSKFDNITYEHPTKRTH